MGGGGQSSATIVVFVLVHLCKLPLYYSLQQHVLSPLFDELVGSLRLEDVAQPALLTRLGAATAREVVVRAHAVLSWIWANFVIMDGTNTILALVAVLSGLDHPDDWPPLFGSPRDARGMRGFWGRFWHRSAVRPYSSVGRWLVSRHKDPTGTTNTPTGAGEEVVASVLFFFFFFFCDRGGRRGLCRLPDLRPLAHGCQLAPRRGA